MLAVVVTVTVVLAPVVAAHQPAGAAPGQAPGEGLGSSVEATTGVIAGTGPNVTLSADGPSRSAADHHTRLVNTTVDRDITFDNGSNYRLRLTNADTGDAVTVTVNASANLTGPHIVAFWLYEADGSPASSPTVGLSENDGPNQYRYEADVVSGAIPAASNLTNFSVTLLDGNGTVIDSTAAVPHYVDYTGVPTQNSTDGTVAVSFPREALPKSANGTLTFSRGDRHDGSTNYSVDMAYESASDAFVARIDAFQYDAGNYSWTAEFTDGDGTELLEVQSQGSSKGNVTLDPLVVNGTVEINGTGAARDKVATLGVDDYGYGSIGTGSNGEFRMPIGESGTYDLVFIQENESTGGANTQRDGYADVYTLDRVHVNGTTDAGTLTVAEGHLVNVTVVDGNGDPIEGANVLVAHQPDYASNASTIWISDTSARGLVEPNDDVAPGVELVGDVRIQVQKSGYEDNATELTVTGPRNVTLTMAEKPTVNGTLETAGGTAGAEDDIDLRGVDVKEWGTTRANANGSFTVGVTGEGTYDLSVLQRNESNGDTRTQRDGYADVYTADRLDVTGDVDVGNVTLPAAHLVNVTVVDANGDPVEGADVRVAHRPDYAPNATYDWLNTTSDRGLIERNPDVDPGVELVGHVHIRAYKRGYYADWTELNVTSDRTVTLTLEERGRVNGTLETAGGDAVDSADVWLSGVNVSTNFGTDTDASGAFDLDVDKGTYDLVAVQKNDSNGGNRTQRDGYADVYTADRLDVTGTVDVGTVTLPSAHLVNVTVVDQNGDPVEDARIRVAHQPEYAPNASSESLGTTSARGLLERNPDVAPGVELVGPVRMVASKDGYSYNATTLTVTGDRTVTLVLEKENTVSGSVERADGSAAVDDRVHFHGVDVSQHLHTPTNATGQFSRTVDPDGTYDVAVLQMNESAGGNKTERDGYADIYTFDRRTVDGDVDVGTLTLPEAHLVNITVVDQDGTPVGDANVWVSHRPDYAPNATFSLATGTSARGVLDTNPDVPPGVELVGEVQITASKRGYDVNRTQLNVTGPRSVTLAIEEKKNVSGQVVDSSGQGLEGDLVVANGPDSNAFPRTNATGNWSGTIGPDDPTRFTYYQYNESTGDYFPRDGTVDLYALGTRNVTGDVDLGTQTVPDGHLVNLTVVNESGDPVEDAYVFLRPRTVEGTYGYGSYTNADGMYQPNENASAGIELVGNVSFVVESPGNSTAYVDREYWKNVTVTSDRELTVTLESNGTAETGSWNVSTDGRLQYAQVAAGSELVYAGGLDDTVTAIDRTTGTVAWTFDRAGSLADSGPALQDGTVFVGSGGGVVYALNATTGATEWTHQTDSAVVSSPTVDNGTVYVGSNDGTVLALDAATGSQQWTHEAGAAVLSRPAVGSGSVFVTTDAGDVVALDAATGSQQWSHATGVALGHSSPTVANATVFVAADTLTALDPATGSVQWTTPYGGTAGASPTADAGTVYVGAANGTVAAVDATTGSIQWQFAADATVATTPAAADGRLVAASTAGTVYVLDAGTGASLDQSRVDDAVRTPLTIAGDDAYLGTRNGTVVAIGNVTGTTTTTFTTTTTDTSSDSDGDTSSQDGPTVRGGVVGPSDATGTERDDDEEPTPYQTTTAVEESASETTPTDTTGSSTTLNTTTDGGDSSSSDDTVDEMSSNGTDGPAPATATPTADDRTTPTEHADDATSADGAPSNSRTETATATAVADTRTPPSSETPTASSTDDSSGAVEAMRAPGFGVVLALLALLGGGVLVARRRTGR